MSEHSEHSGVLSPYVAKSTHRMLTKEDLDKVKEILGMKCVFIVADTEKHDCTAATCTGHHYSILQSGFSVDQMDGIVMGLYERLQDGLFIKEV